VLRGVEHADPITEEGASGTRADRIEGEDSNRHIPHRYFSSYPTQQRTLASSRRPSDRDDRCVSSALARKQMSHVRITLQEGECARKGGTIPIPNTFEQVSQVLRHLDSRAPHWLTNMRFDEANDF
jgi:hypothetical protein